MEQSKNVFVKMLLKILYRNLSNSHQLKISQNISDPCIMATLMLDYVDMADDDQFNEIINKLEHVLIKSKNDEYNINEFVMPNMIFQFLFSF